MKSLLCNHEPTEFFPLEIQLWCCSKCSLWLKKKKECSGIFLRAQVMELSQIQECGLLIFYFWSNSPSILVGKYLKSLVYSFEL